MPHSPSPEGDGYKPDREASRFSERSNPAPSINTRRLQTTSHLASRASSLSRRQGPPAHLNVAPKGTDRTDRYCLCRTAWSTPWKARCSTRPRIDSAAHTDPSRFTCKPALFEVEPRGVEPLTPAVQRRHDTLPKTSEACKIPSDADLLAMMLCSSFQEIHSGCCTDWSTNDARRPHISKQVQA